MYSLKERFANLHIDVIDTLFTEEAPEDYNNKSLYYMAKSIDAMGKVDAVYFTRDWHTSRGCRIERQVAKEYGVKILEWDFLEEDKETIKRLKWKPHKHLTDEEIKELTKIDERIRGGWTRPPETPADMWPEKPIIRYSDPNLKGENLDIWQE